MKLIYENEMGRVVLSGEGKGTFRITELSGLSLPDTEADTVRYPDAPGQMVNRISVLARTITVAGDIWDETGVAVSRAMGVLMHPGILTVSTPRFERCAPCRSISFLPGAKRGDYLCYTLQLVCDNPYFSDKKAQKDVVATKKAMLKTSFTLPAMLSKRTTSARVINRGNVAVMPRILLQTPVAATFPKGLLLQNRTTGKSLTLHLTLSAGETLTVDCENRKIYTDKQENLLGCLDSDCVMSAFSFVPGVNEIAVFAEDEIAKFSVSCSFCNQYGEAIG